MCIRDSPYFRHTAPLPSWINQQRKLGQWGQHIEQGLYRLQQMCIRDSEKAQVELCKADINNFLCPTRTYVLTPKYSALQGLN